MNRQLSVIDEDNEEINSNIKGTLTDTRTKKSNTNLECVSVSNFDTFVSTLEAAKQKKSSLEKSKLKQSATVHIGTPYQSFKPVTKNSKSKNLQSFNTIVERQRKKSMIFDGGIFKIDDIESYNDKRFNSPEITNTPSKRKTKLDSIKRNSISKSNEKILKKSYSTLESTSNNMNFHKINNNKYFDESPKKSEKNTNTLTMEQIAHDINKPFLTFNKKSSGTGPVRGYKDFKSIYKSSFKLNSKKSNNNLLSSAVEANSEVNSIVENKKGKKKLQFQIDLLKSPIRNSKKEDSLSLNNVVSKKIDSRVSIEKSIYKKKSGGKTITDIVGHEKSKWSKFRNAYNVLTSILFIKREICTFGVAPRIEKIKPDSELDIKNSLYDTKSTKIEMESFTFSRIKSSDFEVNYSNFIILPNSRFSKIWNYFLFILCLYSIVVMPFRISFTDNFLNPEYTVFYFDIIVEIFYFFEIIKTFFTAVYIKGIFITSYFKIFINYLQGWLLIDLLSIYPYYIMEYYFANNSKVSTNTLLIIFKIPKVFRLVRTLKFLKLVNSLESSNFVTKIAAILGFHFGILKLISFFFTVGIICHIFSCIWYYCAKLNNFDPDTWVYRNGYADDDIMTLYFKSLYFAFSSFLTIGYGDIYAYSDTELVLICIWLLVGGLYYSFSISSLGNLFSKYNAGLVQLNRKYNVMAEVAKKNNFNGNLLEQLKFYYQNLNKKEEKNYDFKLVLTELPSNIKYSIANSIYEGQVLNVHIFKESNRSFISNIIPLLKPKYFKKGATIYPYDEVPELVYFIMKGEVCFLTIDEIIFAKMSEYSYFGEIEILKKTYRESTVLANSDCMLLTLSKKVLLEDVTQNHIEFFNQLITNMIKRFQFVQNVFNTIEAIIEEGINIDFKVNKHKKNQIQLTKKELFNIGIKARLENPKYNKTQKSYVNTDVSQRRTIKTESILDENKIELSHVNSEDESNENNFSISKYSRSKRKKSTIIRRTIDNSIQSHESIQELKFTKQNSFEIFGIGKKVKKNKELYNEVVKLKEDNINLFKLMEKVNNNLEIFNSKEKKYDKNVPKKTKTIVKTVVDEHIWNRRKTEIKIKQKVLDGDTNPESLKKKRNSNFELFRRKIDFVDDQNGNSSPNFSHKEDINESDVIKRLIDLNNNSIKF